MSVDALVARLAGRQNGVVTHWQLVEIGLSSAAIARRAANGRLHRVHRGVYLVGHLAPSPLVVETAALFACGSGAVLSHRTAARLEELIDLPEPVIDVTVPRRHGRERDRIRLHRTRDLKPGDVRRHQRLPVTSPLRTILDLAGTEDRRDVERACNEALVQRLVSLNQLSRRLTRERGRRGVAMLRQIIESHRQPTMTRTEAENLFLVLVEKSGLPVPRTNFPIGPYHVDFAWPDRRLVGELDSIKFHSAQPKFVGDRRRWADLDALGWRLFRFTWWDVIDEPEALLVRLTRSLVRDDV